MYSVCISCAVKKTNEHFFLFFFLVTLAHNTDLDKAKHSEI